MQLSCSGLMVMRAAMRLGHTTADGLMFLRAGGMLTPPSHLKPRIGREIVADPDVVRFGPGERRGLDLDTDPLSLASGKRPR